MHGQWQGMPLCNPTLFQCVGDWQKLWFIDVMHPHDLVGNAPHDLQFQCDIQCGPITHKHIAWITAYGLGCFLPGGLVVWTCHIFLVCLADYMSAPPSAMAPCVCNSTRHMRPVIVVLALALRARARKRRHVSAMIIYCCALSTCMAMILFLGSHALTTCITNKMLASSTRANGHRAVVVRQDKCCRGLVSLFPGLEPRQSPHAAPATTCSGTHHVHVVPPCRTPQYIRAAARVYITLFIPLFFGPYYAYVAATANLGYAIVFSIVVRASALNEAGFTALMVWCEQCCFKGTWPRGCRNGLAVTLKRLKLTFKLCSLC